MSREVPKKPLVELIDVLIDASSKFPKGTTLKHHSGDKYTVVGQCIDCKTNELMMIYYKFDPNTFNEVTFVRPFSDFVEPRFTIIRERQVWLTDEQYNQLRGENNK